MRKVLYHVLALSAVALVWIGVVIVVTSIAEADGHWKPVTSRDLAERVCTEVFLGSPINHEILLVGSYDDLHYTDDSDVDAEGRWVAEADVAGVMGITCSLDVWSDASRPRYRMHELSSVYADQQRRKWNTQPVATADGPVEV